MGLFGKAKTITTLYDDGYLDDQLKKLSKILPAIKGRKINVAYVPNADRYDESLDKIDKIKSLDEKRMAIDVTEPVTFYMKDGKMYQDNNTPKIMMHIE